MSTVPTEDIRLVHSTSDTPKEWKDNILPYTLGKSDYHIWEKLAEYNYPKSASMRYSLSVQVVDGLVENFKKYCAAKGATKLLDEGVYASTGAVKYSIRRNIEYMVESLTYTGLLMHINARSAGDIAESNYTGAEIEVIMYNSLINFYSSRYVWGKVIENTVTNSSLITLDNGVVVKASPVDYSLYLHDRRYKYLPDQLDVCLSFPLVDNYDAEKLRIHIGESKHPTMIVSVSVGFDDILAYMIWGHFGLDVFKDIPFAAVNDETRRISAIVFVNDWGLVTFDKDTLSTCKIKHLLTKATNMFKK